MKKIEQVREEDTEGPKGHGKENLSFNAENVHRSECEHKYGRDGSDYDLGMKKFE